MSSSGNGYSNFPQSTAESKTSYKYEILLIKVSALITVINVFGQNKTTMTCHNHFQYSLTLTGVNYCLKKSEKYGLWGISKLFGVRCIPYVSVTLIALTAKCANYGKNMDSLDPWGQPIMWLKTRGDWGKSRGELLIGDFHRAEPCLRRPGLPAATVVASASSCLSFLS